MAVSEGPALPLPEAVEPQERGSVEPVQHRHDLLLPVALPEGAGGDREGLSGARRVLTPHWSPAWSCPGAHRESRSSCSACSTRRVMFSDMMQKGKFCEKNESDHDNPPPRCPPACLHSPKPGGQRLQAPLELLRPRDPGSEAPTSTSTSLRSETPPENLPSMKPTPGLGLIRRWQLPGASECRGVSLGRRCRCLPFSQRAEPATRRERRRKDVPGSRAGTT